MKNLTRDKDYFKIYIGNSLAVQWLGLRAFTAEGPSSIPGRGTKILQVARRSKKKKKKYIESILQNLYKEKLGDAQ